MLSYRNDAVNKIHTNMSFFVFVSVSLIFVTFVLHVYHTYLYNFCPTCGSQLSTIQYNCAMEESGI